MTKEEAVKLLAEKCEELHKLFNECVAIADENEIIFELPYGGEGTAERGLGGYYDPTGEVRVWSDYQGWNPSSQSC
jgi:hypothetical protein